MPSYIYNMTDTWNDSGKVWSSIKMNVQGDAYHADSRVVDLLLDGTSSFSIRAGGGLDILSDSDGLSLGSVGQAAVRYDGTNLLINPMVSGTGDAVIVGGLNVQGTITAASLPTSDPVVVGELWNDSGTVKISAG